MYDLYPENCSSLPSPTWTTIVPLSRTSFETK